MVDLRSDTVTEPTDEMREAMRSARVGDDAYGEDPTVNELQELAAKNVGKEAALFVPSGTMGNEIAIYVHSGREGEILVERDSHIVLFETGGPAVLSGVQLRTLAGKHGVFSAREVAEAIRDPTDPHEPLTTMVGIENSHNMAGGTVWTPAQTASVARVAHDVGIPVHLDGARLFNGAVAQGLAAPALTKSVDSVMFALTKGLSCPVGSLICGSRDFVDQALRARKLFGGGMRQAGVLAAPGIVALSTMIDRLKDDHANARRLANGLAKIPGLTVDLETVQTNIVFLDVSGIGASAKEFEARMAAEGVRCSAYGPRWIRFVTHRHVQREDVDRAVLVAREVTRRPEGRAPSVAARASASRR